MSRVRRIANAATAQSVGSRWRVAARAVLLCAIGFGLPLTGEQVALIGVAVEAVILAIQETQGWRASA